MTAQSCAGRSKETDHGERNTYHLTAYREEHLLRHLRLLVLFLRVPGQCLSLRTDRLPMWLSPAVFQSVDQPVPPPELRGGGHRIVTDKSMCCDGARGEGWGILRLLWFQLGEERGQGENGRAFMLTECQQMAIARYDMIRMGFEGAFENAVVGFILQEMQGRSGT